MKRILFSAMAVLTAMYSFGQWEPIVIGNTTTSITALSSLQGYVNVGFDGDGIYQSADGGSTWVDITGDLTNTHINFLYGGSAVEPLIIGTDGGPFLSISGMYLDCSGTGLPETDITYFNLVEEGLWAVGTRNQGVFTALGNDFAWTSANTGLVGNALQINSINGHRDVSNIWGANTNNGIYFTNDFVSWSSGNNGLTGNELITSGSLIIMDTMVLITTHSGAFRTSDLGQSWTTLIPDVKFNTLIAAYNSGLPAIFFLGENSYVTSDFTTFTQIPSPGEVIAATATETELFVATAPSKNGESNGGLYKQPIASAVTGISSTNSNSGINQIQQNNPNPFSQSTTINYSVEESDLVTITIYDVMGREISTLVNEFTPTGNHQVTLENSDLPAGLYYAVLKTKNYSSQIKMIKE